MLGYLSARYNLGDTGLDIFAYVDRSAHRFLNDRALVDLYDVANKKDIVGRMSKAYNAAWCEAGDYVYGHASIVVKRKGGIADYSLFMDKPIFSVCPYIFNKGVVFVPSNMQVWLEEVEDNWWGNEDSDIWWEYADLKYKNHVDKEVSIHGLDILSYDYTIEREDNMSYTLVYKNHRIAACKSLKMFVDELHNKYFKKD